MKHFNFEVLIYMCNTFPFACHKCPKPENIGIGNLIDFFEMPLNKLFFMLHVGGVK